MTTREKTKGLPWEDAAELRNVIGWACKTCNRFWGEGASGERAARCCHALDAPCECGSRRHKQYSVCDDCRAKRSAERYYALEEVEWDGETPLVDYDGDRYLFDIDDLANFLDGCEFPLTSSAISEDEYLELAINSVQLCVCKKQQSPQFNLLDMLPDDNDVKLDAGGLAAEKAVNDWLAQYGLLWIQANKRPSLASLRRHLGLPAVEPGGKSQRGVK